MQRRLAAALLVLLAAQPGCSAPARCDATGSLALTGADEPGKRFVVSGIVRRDGRPVAGARVLVYHTDAEGYYRRSPEGRELGSRDARLKGTVCTDEEGRYEVRTIRPARYPGGGPPEHVHLLVWPAGDSGGADGHAAEVVLDQVKVERAADGVERVTFDLELP